MLDPTNKDKVNSLIGKGEIKKALTHLIEALKELNNTKILNDAILLQSRWNNLRKKYTIQNALSLSEYEVEKSKIVAGIQELMETDYSIAKINNKRRSIAGLIVIIISIPVLIFLFQLGTTDNNPNTGKHKEDNNISKEEENDKSKQLDTSKLIESKPSREGEIKHIDEDPPNNSNQKSKIEYDTLIIFLNQAHSKVNIDGSPAKIIKGSDMRRKTIILTKERHLINIVENGKTIPGVYISPPFDNIIYEESIRN